ncbi:putative WRKY transcription factor 70 [Raphanus sativus]|uniref:Probable WRKY transcription factor 70 n=1 Tax=Raphanus sativus TaxID=3726 RepID=A0A6J0M671_RAPSA|nr:probable WRKY transcription factor 70 [Raphanus sativus]KAJ4905116.1 putative WRKY transcription factor 70 [Raphanus sativus]
MDIASNNKAIMLEVIDQLVQGHELATKLQQLLSQHGSGLGPAEDLVAKISGSFSDSISALDSIEHIPSSLFTAVEGSQNASCNNDGKLEDSVDSRKRLGPVKNKRGCYKRKKRADTWTVESTLLEDAFSWRKYGKKEILNAKFPRSYFRCTHKYTQGCKATKQVQKLELESKMFSITYIGNHTCNSDEVTPKCPSLTTSVNEEENNHHNGSSTESDLQLVWQEMLVFEEEHNHHHHEAIYGCGENSASINGLDTTDLWSWQQLSVQPQ